MTNEAKSGGPITPEANQPKGFWDEWVENNFPFTDTPYHNEVWTISGQKATGRSSVASFLKMWLERDGFTVLVDNPREYLSEDEIADGPKKRPLAINRKVDSKMATTMLHPANAGKIIILDSRLGGVNARNVELAIKRQGKILPATFHNVLLHSPEEARDELLQIQDMPNAREYEEVEGSNFSAYPELPEDLNEIFNSGYRDAEGNPVYKYTYLSTPDWVRPIDIARDLLTKMRLESIPSLNSK